MLSDLAEATDAELAWASYWRSRANTWIAPRIGLPSIRNVPIPSHWTPAIGLTRSHIEQARIWLINLRGNPDYSS